MAMSSAAQEALWVSGLSEEIERQPGSKKSGIKWCLSTKDQAHRRTTPFFERESAGEACLLHVHAHQEDGRRILD
ncbi:unnamed protein product [Nezara viridula]|uniref:Uncharacterized protein n=1 Tax=Nezara viridula TaxID=85310 RepID=A0A9P0H1U1_NEZVI|nr:unnamed protein product [Nezara viridula]